MKKILLVCSLCAIGVLPWIKKCNAQALTDWGIGYDLGTNKLLANISAGYELNHIRLEAEMRPSLSRMVGVNNYFGAKVGYDIAGRIIPSVGYYYNLRDGDNKSLNEYAVGYSVKALVPVGVPCTFVTGRGLFFSGMYIRNQVQLTAGIYCIF